MVENSLEMVSHYVGHALLKARFQLENGNIEELDQKRTNLINQLQQYSSDLSVKQCIDFLQREMWRTSYDIERFDRRYRKITEPSKMSEVIHKLFHSNGA